MDCINANMIVCIDETGTDHRDANRRCGYHLHGTTVSHTLSNRGRQLSAITVLSTCRIEDIHLTEVTQCYILWVSLKPGTKRTGPDQK